MNKTRIDFQVVAFNLHPPAWPVRNCSLCNYELSYVFDQTWEHVGFDSGCYCSNTKNINQCSWDRLAEFYNMQTDKEVIEEMNKFWGFK